MGRLDQCFGCGKDNPHGLRLKFVQDGEDAIAFYRCSEVHAGWPGIQHGGVTSAVLDEAAGYVPHFLGLIAMTATLEIAFAKPIHVGEALRVVGRPIKKSKRVVEVESVISGENGELKARAVAKMFILSPQQKAELGLTDIT